MAIAEQRSSFGVLHFTSHSSSGKNDRKRFKFHVERVLQGELAKEYHDTDTGRFVQEFRVPVRAGRTVHGLTTDLASIKVSKGRNASVQVVAPGRGSVVPLAVGSGPEKPGVAAKLQRKKFTENRVTLNDMAMTKLLLAAIGEVLDANQGLMPMPLPSDAVAVAIALVQSKMLDGEMERRIERILTTKPEAR